MKLVLAIATILDLEVHQLDVMTAFLESDVDELIIMEQPEGYAVDGLDGERMVCKLNKSLYGLKQAPRNWNRDIDKSLRDLGFEPSAVIICI